MLRSTLEVIVNVSSEGGEREYEGEFEGSEGRAQAAMQSLP